MNYRKRWVAILFLFLAGGAVGQGVISGNVMTEDKKAVVGATVVFVAGTDSTGRKTIITDKSGLFNLTNVAFGYYSLRISYSGMQPMTIDSIHFRPERSDFNLNDIILKPFNRELDEVIVYAEKPLIQSKDGNITFNAGESALAAGSNASDLLSNIPLVTKDPNGKITIRGKEPKILIDDKPVELNAQQLQDLLESLPGSSIEKIEVMTHPPPQYANEQGGVINIITKKGRIGKSGRINVSAGSRGEASLNGNYSYRKQGLSVTLNTGVSYNRIKGEGYSIRNNFYTDSSNFFRTENVYLNRIWRPNLRLNAEYDLNKTEAVSLVLQYNQNDYNNTSTTEYRNINRFGNTYRLSERVIPNRGETFSPNINLSYTKKGKIPGENLKLFGNANYSVNDADRDFYQQFFYPDHTPNGVDSTQQQLSNSKTTGYNFRLDYNRPLVNKKTIFSGGLNIIRSNNHIVVDASYLKKPEMTFIESPLLSNDFIFHQTILNARGSLKQILKENFSITMGTSVEQTLIWFELFKDNRNVKNDYWTWLPFATINRSWKEKVHVTLSYRRSIRRPGINELNPTIDFGDPYNIRFGNENLEASTAHNFDFVIGRTITAYFVNLGLGFNKVERIFSAVRTLLPDGKTQITWENISNRKEYEISTWGGITVTKKLKTNISSSYTFNEYSEFDKVVHKYRNGGSFTSNFNSTFISSEVLNFTGSFTFNRFSNPQGFGRWNWSMNLGIQRKLLDKKLTITGNIIDPFVQENRNYTYGSNFYLQNFSTAQTRNFRLSVAYNFNKQAKKAPAKKPIKSAKK